MELGDERSKGDKLNIAVVHQGSNACSTYSDYKVQRDGNTIEIEMFHKTPVEEFCNSVAIEIETDIEIKLKKRGTTLLRFKQYDANFLEETIEVE